MGAGSEDNISAQRRSSVSRMLRSFSQALGITKSQIDVEKIVSYKDGKFIMNDEELEKVLINGTDNEQVMALQLLQEEMINITFTKRMKLWGEVKGSIDLKREGSVRTECFKLLNTILKITEGPDVSMNAVFNDIYLNIHLHYNGGNGVDRDMKLIISCFHNLIKYYTELDTFNEVTGSKLNEFLIGLFNESLNDDEEAQILMISLISECIKKEPKLFSKEELERLLSRTISINIKTLNLITIKSFVEFFESYLLTNGEFINKLYTIFSILGCANCLEEMDSIMKCETFLDKLILHEYGDKVLITLCDVISCKYDDIYEHRKGDKSVLGCIRYFGYILKFLGNKQDGKNNVVTVFFYSNLYYLFQSFIEVSKCKDIYKSIEILKFIDELLEKPYSIKGYYRYFIEQNLFWELLNDLNWEDGKNDIKYSYQTVQNELFNKLQNLKINLYYEKKLIQYFESNYKILSSYNIEFILNYYSENLLCICGTPNWKQNCEAIVERYYSILPLNVLNILKSAFLQCNSLKIDEPSLNFYINMICYLCIINVPFELDNGIVDSLTDIIIKLDDKMFAKVINDYFKEIVHSQDLNFEIMDMSIILLIFKSIKDRNRMKFLMDEFYQNTTKLKTGNLVLYHLILMTSIRCNEGGGHYFENEQGNYELFSPKISGYFANNKTKTEQFDIVLNMNKALELYSHVLETTTNMKHYLFVCENIKSQLLNVELFNNEQGISAIIKLFKLIISQIEEVYTFKFKQKNMKRRLIGLLYAFSGYIGIIEDKQWCEIIKSIVIEFKFAREENKVEIINYLNVCMFEMPLIMKEFRMSILKIIKDGLKSCELFFSNLEILFNIVVTGGLEEEESEIIYEILQYIEDLKCDESSDFDYIKDYKVLNELIESLIENGEAVKTLKPKTKIRVVNGEGVLSELLSRLKEDTVSKYLDLDDNIMERDEDDDPADSQDDGIKIVMNDYDSDDGYMSGKKIVVNRIEDSKYYKIDNYNFKYISINSVIVKEDNLVEYMKRLVQLCAIATI